MTSPCPIRQRHRGDCQVRERHRGRWRRGDCEGFSYIEVFFALSILTLCITPAMRMVPTLLSGQRDLETRYQLSLIAQDKLEALLLGLEINFADLALSGNLAGEGHPTWVYKASASVPSAPGDRYATIQVVAWDDANGNAVADAGEAHVRYDTIQSNLAWSPP